MYNFQANYNKILEVLFSLDNKMSYLHQIRKPKLKYKEFITIDLTSEYMNIDSECQLFRVLPVSLAEKIERSVYNRKKRKLFFFKELLRKQLVKRLNISQDYFIVDSMPLEVCKLSRSGRSKICKEQHYVFKKSRKRIESLFSQLCDQFMIKRNYAKSFDGFKNRILSKITALTVIQYTNRFIFNRNINNLKINIS